MERQLLAVLLGRGEADALFQSPLWRQLCQIVDRWPRQAFALARIKGRHAMTPRHAIAVFLTLRSWLGGHRLGSQLEAVSRAALLHDLGHWRNKALLHVGTPFTHEQARVCRQHVQALEGETGLGDQEKSWISQHHQRPDGRGYPPGSPSDPLGQALAIVEAFEGLTTERSFRPALNYGQAVDFLVRRAGPVFDAGLLASFLSFCGSWPFGTFLRLQSGELAISLPPDGQEQPVLVLSDRFGDPLPPLDQQTLTKPQLHRQPFTWRSCPLPEQWSWLRPDLTELPRSLLDSTPDGEPCGDL